jgi:apolipoprotein N-acyltransferase
MFGYGFMRPDAPPSAGPLQVRVVQPDAPQSEKMSGDYARRLWLRLLDISFAPGADQAQVIIWPEGVLPFLDEAPEALAILSARMAKGQFVLAGSARRAVSDDGRMRFYNALLAIGSDGRVAAIYDKAHLVPVGEYLPFPAFFESLGIGSLNARVANAFSQGPGLQTLSLSGLPPFGPLICYEALFPAAVVAGGAPRPGWLVNVTDDSWFGTGTGPWQHLAAVRFRAIEEGLPIVRSATTGISSVIDARGRILAFLPLSQSGSLDVSLTPGSGSTLFSQHGHVSVLVLTLMLLAVGFALKNKD